MILNKLGSNIDGVAKALALSFVLSTASDVACAQEDVQASNIVRPQADSNGVDLALGGITIQEPNFFAPAASKLQLAVGRNEKGNEINSLYTTLVAKYLDPFGDGAPWPRMYTAVVAGLSVRFECSDVGGNSLSCDEMPPRKGATLEHFNGSYLNGYVFTASNGTRAQFPSFPYEPEVDNVTLEAPEVLFPSGEKITFQHTLLSGVATRKWTSNLGYSASMAVTGTGNSEVRQLYKGTTLLNSLTTVREDVVGSPHSSYTRRITDDMGRNFRFRYMHVGGPYWDQLFKGLWWFEDATGLRTTLGYHGVTNHGNYWSSLSGGLIVSTLERNGQTWTYSDDYSALPPKRITNPLGGIREVLSVPPASTGTYENITSSKSPLGLITAFEYYNYSNAYEAVDLLSAATFPEGNKIEYEYDTRGNLKKSTEIPKTGGAGRIVYQAEFPSSCTNRKTCNKPQWTRDSAGAQTDYTYDATHGGLLTKLEPVDANGKRRKAWNEYVSNNTGSGLVWRLSATHLCSVNSNGTNHDCQTAAEQVTTFTYWENSFLPLTVTRGNGANSISATTTYSYDAWGRITAATDPTNATNYSRYDVVGRRTWEIVANGAGTWAARNISYDSGDRVTRIDRGTLPNPSSSALAINGSTINSYDLEGRLVKTEFVDSIQGRLTVQQTAYDAISRPICFATRMNPAAFDSTSNACALGSASTFGSDRITQYSFDIDSRLTKTIRGLGVLNGGLGIADVEMDYTSNGNISWRKDGNGNQTTYTYDSYDRLDRATFADTSFEKSEYDSAGRLWKFTKRNGQWLTHGYDGASRLTLTTFSNSEPSVIRDYDGQGRPVTISSGGNVIANSWSDPLGRLSSQTQPTGTVAYAYDLSGRQSRITWPGNYWVDYDYNSAGSLWRVRELGATSGLGMVASWTFDGLGRRATMTRGNGVVTSVIRDSADRLTNLGHDVAGTALDSQYSFDRNPASQIIGRTFTNNSWIWNPGTFSAATYSPDSLNRYSAVGGAVFAYDGNGNLTGDGSRSYGYDFLSHLTSVSGGGAAAATLTYDPLERLSSVSVNSFSTRFLYDGSRVIADYDGNGNLLHRYIPGLGAEMPLLSLEGNATAAGAGSAPNNARWPVADERGSIVGLANAAGAVAINRYGSYGEPDSTNVGRFGYTGQLWLPEAGLYHFKARAYNPHLGRFMQTDPVGYADGMNLYTYVHNDPLNFFDPTGTQTENGLPFGVDHERRTPEPKDDCFDKPEKCFDSPKAELTPPDTTINPVTGDVIDHNEERRKQQQKAPDEVKREKAPDVPTDKEPAPRIAPHEYENSADGTGPAGMNNAIQMQAFAASQQRKAYLDGDIEDAKKWEAAKMDAMFMEFELRGTPLNPADYGKPTGTRW